MNRPGLPSLILGAATFAVGLVVGGLGPRSEVRRLQEEIFELKKEGLGENRVGAELVELIQGGFDGERERVPVDGDEPVRLVGQPGDDAPDDGGAREDPADDDTDPVLAFDDEGDAPDPDQTVREGMALRYAQARAALWEDIAPTADQEVQIEGVLGSMNDELISLAYEVVDDIAAGGEPGRRAMMSYTADALDVMVRAEDSLLATMTPEQRDAVREEATDPTSFIDPAVIDVFSELREAQELE